jgi:hypothetical protein
MSKKRKKRSSQFKAKVALAALTNEEWGKLEKVDTKVYDEQHTGVSRWNGSHTASTPKN